jgi:hypothetical protein
MIDKSSRYAGTGTYSAVDASGESVEGLELRSIPQVHGVFLHTVREGERLDHLAQRYFRDPKRFWKICDASDELDPFEVLVPGRSVLIPPNK